MPDKRTLSQSVGRTVAGCFRLRLLVAGALVVGATTLFAAGCTDNSGNGNFKQPTVAGSAGSGGAAGDGGGGTGGDGSGGGGGDTGGGGTGGDGSGGGGAGGTTGSGGAAGSGGTSG